MTDDPSSAERRGGGPEPTEAVDADDDDRAALVFLVPAGRGSSGSWEPDPLPSMDPGSEIWERVLRSGQRQRILERIVVADGDPPPRGAGWSLRTTPHAWVERIVRDPERDWFVEEQGGPQFDPSDFQDRSASTVFNPRTGNRLRAWITLSLTLSVVGVVALGLLFEVPPDQFAVYVAPLLTLAGTALGYWFGSEK